MKKFNYCKRRFFSNKKSNSNSKFMSNIGYPKLKTLPHPNKNSEIPNILNFYVYIFAYHTFVNILLRLLVYFYARQYLFMLLIILLRLVIYLFTLLIILLRSSLSFHTSHYLCTLSHYLLTLQRTKFGSPRVSKLFQMTPLEGQFICKKYDSLRESF